MTKSSMNISLPSPLLAFAEEQVENESYGNKSAYIRALIIQDKKRLAEEKLTSLLVVGMKDLNEGRYIKIKNNQEHDAFFDNVLKKGKSLAS